MGVYIFNVDMPSSGVSILAIRSDGFVEDVTGSVIGIAKQVAEHGDLVDRAKLMAEEQRFICEDEYGDWYIPCYAINKAPIVIEAE